MGVKVGAQRYGDLAAVGRSPGIQPVRNGGARSPVALSSAKVCAWLATAMRSRALAGPPQGTRLVDQADRGLPDAFAVEFDARDAPTTIVSVVHHRDACLGDAPTAA